MIRFRQLKWSVRLLGIKAAAFCSSEVLRAGSLISGLGIATGVGAYCYQLAMAALLRPDDFTTLNAIFAMAGIGLAPLGAMRMVAVRHLAAVAVIDGRGGIHYWAFRCSFGIMGLIAVIGAVLWMFQTQAMSSLRLPDIVTLWLFFGVVGCNMMTLALVPALSALKFYAVLGIMPLWSVIGKALLAPVCIIGFGWGLCGALFADVAGNVLALGAGGVFVWSWLRDSPRARPRGQPFAVSLLAPAAIAILGLASMQQVDILIVTRYFVTATANEYVPAAVLGKVVLYLPGGLVAALLPIVSASAARLEGVRQHAVEAIGATLVVCGLSSLACWIVGPWFVTTLYGGKFGRAGELLGLYAIAMVPMAVAMVMQGFLFARGKALYCWAIGILACSELVVMHAWHPSLSAVIGIVGGFNAALAVIGGILMVPEMREAACSSAAP